MIDISLLVGISLTLGFVLVMNIFQVLSFVLQTFTCRRVLVVWTLALNSSHVLHASRMKPLQVTPQESAEYVNYWALSDDSKAGLFITLNLQFLEKQNLRPAITGCFHQ